MDEKDSHKIPAYQLKKNYPEHGWELGDPIKGFQWVSQDKKYFIINAHVRHFEVLHHGILFNLWIIKNKATVAQR